jgi:hypothetical protein
MADDKQHEIVLRFNQAELETIRRASGSLGTEDAAVAKWIRQLVLEKAGSRIAQDDPGSPPASAPPPQAKPPTSKGLGPCRCGLSRDVRGECDGSCVMQY